MLLLITGFPMLENLIMMQHAYQFSFDRIKLAAPLLILLSIICLKVSGDRWVKALVSVSVLTIATNVLVFLYDGHRFREWGNATQQNEAVVTRLKQDPLSECSVYGTKRQVRGYLNLLFQRDIFEWSDFSDLVRQARESCGLILIHTDKVFTDLPRVTLVEVFDPTGRLLRTYAPLA